MSWIKSLFHRGKVQPKLATLHFLKPVETLKMETQVQAKAKEVFWEAKTFRKELACPVCNSGFLRRVGMPDINGNVHHQCSNAACVHRAILNRTSYPQTVVMEVPIHEEPIGVIVSVGQ